MDQDVRAGLSLAGLGIAISLGLAALTLDGSLYMLWADAFFGFVASGLLYLGLCDLRVIDLT